MDDEELNKDAEAKEAEHSLPVVFEIWSVLATLQVFSQLHRLRKRIGRLLESESSRSKVKELHHKENLIDERKVVQLLCWQVIFSLVELLLVPFRRP